MKKSLIALAVLAASGASFAQSSVTLYGTLDIGYSKTNFAGAATTKVGQSNGGTNFHTPSIFGLKGSEDLGGGMTANFNLQTGGMDLADGAASGLNFTREAWAGVAGAFGSTRIGRTSSVATQSMASFDFNGIAASSAANAVGVSPVTWFGSSRRNAQFQYATPNFGGVDAGLGIVATGDNLTAASNTNIVSYNGTTFTPSVASTAVPKSYVQARVNYANGPLAAAFTTETKHVQTAGSNGERTAYAVAASYDLGVVKAAASYVVSETKAVTYNTTTAAAQGGKGVYVGLVAPVGAAVKVGAQYARNTTSKDTALELFANYSLSKRTFLYADAGRTNFNASTVKDINKFGLGVVHSF